MVRPFGVSPRGRACPDGLEATQASGSVSRWPCMALINTERTTPERIEIERFDSAAVISTPPASKTSDQEKRGRRWLVFSFLFCPCHLPLVMTGLGVLFGGTAFGALVDRNTLAVGLISGTIYTALLVVGFRHLRAATKDIDCSKGECSIPS